MVSLLSHQVLLQNLYDILLEEFVKQPEGHEKQTPVTSDPCRPTAGFLRYISMTNLAIILDLLLDSYRSLRLYADDIAVYCCDAGGFPDLQGSHLHQLTYLMGSPPVGLHGTSTLAQGLSTC